ncbi:MAG TPA: TonB-dependent receptor [Cryomorphaceae bacterium]|nr:TonB-dependent receptor [Cryomorphaceae bacterium]
MKNAYDHNSLSLSGFQWKNLILIALILQCFSARAQVAAVVDENTKEPLSSATFVAEGIPSFAVTNAKGKADISAFANAEEIEIRLLGYETIRLSYDEIEAMNFKIKLEPADFDLDQVVISGSRRIERDRVIPNRVRKIDPKTIALQNPQTAADLLGASGEVFIQKSQQGGGSPMIRGFSTNRLLIAVDGIRMNTAIFRSGNLQNVISLDPLAMEGAEIIFGPGSVIYGSDAIGGVMSFQTLTPQFSTDDTTIVAGKAMARYASASNERTTHFDVNFGGKKWSSLTSVTYTDFGDLRMGSHGPDEYLRPFSVESSFRTDFVIDNPDPEVQINTAYNQTNLMQKVRFSPNAEWDFSYGFHFSTTSDNPRYDRLIRTQDGLPRSAEWYYGPQLWMMNNLNATHRKSGGIYDILTLRLAYQRFEESRVDRDFNDSLRFVQEEFVDAYTTNLDLTKTLGKGKELIYGVEAVFNQVSSKGTQEDIGGFNFTSTPTAPRYPESDWASYGVYATYRQELTKDLALNAGIRYNAFDIKAQFDTTLTPLPFDRADLNNDAVTGSLGLVYERYSDIRIGAVVSTGFRAPNIDDIGKIFDSEPGSVVIPNPDLDAEYATNFEVGISKVLADKVKIGLTGYYTLLENAMVRRNFTLAGQDSIIYQGELSQVQAIQNAAEARVYGIQAELEIILLKELSLSSQFNWQDGEEELDDGSTSASRHAAPWFGVTRLRYSESNLTLELNTQYSGEVAFADLNVGERGKPYLYATDSNGNPYSPSWYTLNFRATYQLSPTWLISAGVENLTDQRYRTYSSGIAAAGRNVVLSATARF